MLKTLRIIVISAALLVGSVTSFAADEPCIAPKAECFEDVREAAEQGDAKAQFILGGMYQFGDLGVAKDKNKAVRWYRLAAEQGFVEAQYFLGYIYHIAKDYSEALLWYRLAADRGYAKAQYILGYMYYTGEGVAKDYSEASLWYHLAAEQGNANAQVLLGGMYRVGVGVSKDYSEALRFYRLAAEQENVKAQYFLGHMYRIGIGVSKDIREATRWFRLAVEQGYADAQFYLGVIYEQGEGVVADKREAFRLYRLAVEQGYADAQFYLGGKYNDGKGVVKDKREAFRLYRLAAEQGHAGSQLSLGFMYVNGIGIAKDEREAFRWYRLAAEQGIAIAQYSVGRMFYNGEGGVVEDKREAFRWYRLAAEQGEEWAQNNLAVMYATGEGTVQNERDAYIWLLIAKASGSKNAKKGLQLIAQNHSLTPSDIRSAKHEAAQRFKEIENRKNSAQSFDNNLTQKIGEGFAIAKPPEETNIAAEVFENTWRSVVMIKNNAGQGSGVIIRPNLVATNCHVIEGGDVAVYKPENGRINKSAPFSAKVVYRKEEHDFCILEVKGLWGIAAAIRKYDTLKVGENVYALGAPRGLGLSLSNGLISQLRTDEGTRFIQTDAAISPGSSGGGLFDTKGSFIGILTSKYVGEDVEGIGFAIPADLALEF